MSRIYLDREGIGNQDKKQKSTKSVWRIMIRPMFLGYLESGLFQSN